MLRQRARTMDAVALALSLGRTPMEVRARALAIGVELTGEADVMDRAWGSGEISFLRQQYRRMTPAEIGRQLGRSAGAVRHKLQSLGLRKALDPKPEALQAAPVWAPEPMEPELVPLVEAVERRMEQEAEPKSAPWLEPESQMSAEAPERLAEAKEETGAGKDAESVSERASGAGEPFRWWTADEDERLRQLVKDKAPLPELAELFGRSAEEVERRISRVCAEPDPAVQAGNQRWGFRAKKPRPKAKPAGPIPEARLASMSKMDVLRELAGLA
jgi:hypothetical protein